MGGKVAGFDGGLESTLDYISPHFDAFENGAFICAVVLAMVLYRPAEEKN